MINDWNKNEGLKDKPIKHMKNKAKEKWRK